MGDLTLGVWVLHLRVNRAHILGSGAIANRRAVCIGDDRQPGFANGRQSGLGAAGQADRQAPVGLALHDGDLIVLDVIPPHFQYVTDALPGADAQVTDQQRAGTEQVLVM